VRQARARFAQEDGRWRGALVAAPPTLRGRRPFAAPLVSHPTIKTRNKTGATSPRATSSGSSRPAPAPSPCASTPATASSAASSTASTASSFPAG
jgi:hypothetical protein